MLVVNPFCKEILLNLDYSACVDERLQKCIKINSQVIQAQQITNQTKTTTQHFE